MLRLPLLGRAAALLSLLALAAPMAAAQEVSEALVGSWEGPLDVGEEVATVVHIELGPDGALTGTVDSPDQQVWGLPLSSVEVDADGAVRIELAMTAGVFEGGLDPASGELRGLWRQRGTTQDFVLKRVPPPTPLSGERVAQLTGTWEGTLTIGAVELRMAFRLQPRAAGGLGGFLDSVDQGARDIPVTRCDALADGGFRISIGSLGASFVGRLTEQGELSGDFLQSGVVLPIEFVAVERATEVRRPQTPLPPYPYRVEEVAYDNEAGPVRLAGTLTLPAGEGPFAAALLISGSGAQDRDESIFQHQPFLVIADHLTRAGVAVLRVDDRGVGGSGAGPGGATTKDFAGDVAAGVAFLRGRAEIDGGRVGLIGHSEGGVIAPLVAVADPELAFLVMLAGTGEVGAKILLDQTELIGRVSGATEKDLARNRVLQGALFEALLDPDLDQEQRHARFRELIADQPEIAEGEQGENQVQAVIRQLDNAWMRFFLDYDPAPTLRMVKCPVLAMNGRLDLQVPWQANLEAIAAALAKGGNEDFETVDLPGLNHLFQHAETGLVTEYGKIEETFAPEVLEKMAGWILERVGP